jgi:catechol 2,3-dioxygenase-like lactoylglutathione lyase family enzyme
MTLSRKQFLTLTLAGAGAAALVRPRFATAQQAAPNISRIKYVTIGAPDVDAVEAAYTGWLGHTTVERSQVSETMALSWGTPNMAGRPFVLMRPMTGEDVLIRAVETEAVDGYAPMKTIGWNAFEIICDDIDDLHARLIDGSPFEHIGGPANLGGGTSSIRAAQYVGPGGEVLYFNCETGDRSKSGLPDPGEDVGRTNIVILASHDVTATMDAYRQMFGMGQGFSRPQPIGVISEMQGLPADHSYVLGFNGLGEPGNAIEFDQYLEQFGPRPRAMGMLPQGNALVSFNVEDLDAVAADFFGAPIEEYGGRRSATFAGPAGELVELIEEKRRT